MGDFCEKEALDFWKKYCKDIQIGDERHIGVADVMVPPMTDEELDEYCRERSGKVNSYFVKDKLKVLKSDVEVACGMAEGSEIDLLIHQLNAIEYDILLLEKYLGDEEKTQKRKNVTEKCNSFSKV